jgi:hypothetical protein
MSDCIFCKLGSKGTALASNYLQSVGSKLNEKN